MKANINTKIGILSEDWCGKLKLKSEVVMGCEGTFPLIKAFGCVDAMAMENWRNDEHQLMNDINYS